MEQFADDEAMSGSSEEGTLETDPDRMSEDFADFYEGTNDAPGSIDAFEAMRAVAPDEAEALRSEWGADFDDNIALARHAASVIADPELVAVLEASGLGDDPRIVRAAAAIGRALAAGSFDGGGPAVANRTDIEARLDALTKRDDYWDASTQREVRKLYLQLYGPATLASRRRADDGGAVF